MDPYEKCALGRIRDNIPGGRRSRGQVHVQCFVWQGGKDTNVPPQHGDYLHRKLPQSEPARGGTAILRRHRLPLGAIP